MVFLLEFLVFKLVGALVALMSIQSCQLLRFKILFYKQKNYGMALAL